VTVPSVSDAPRVQSLGLLPGGRLARWIPTVGLLFAAALVSRVPGLIRPWFERDEAYIGVQAQALLRGQQLYVDVIDRKPPLAPVLYAVVAGVFGADFRPIRLLLVAWIAATAVLVMALIIQLGASRRAGVIGGVLYVLGTVAFWPRDAQGANYGLWAVLPMVAAVFVAVRAGPGVRRPYAFALAGALVGVAACFKQPFLATLVPVAVAAALGPAPVRSVVATCGALVACVVAIGAYFGLPEMIRWVWVESDEYTLGLDPRAPAKGAFVTGVLALAHAPAVLLAVRAVRNRIPQQGIVWAWLAVSLVAVAVGLRFRHHYYQQVLPPLCVLAGIGSDAVRQWVRTVAIAVMAAIAAVCVIAALSWAAPKGQELHALVSFIKSQTQPDDPILVWGTIPEIYWRADRPIAGRFVHHRFVIQLGDREIVEGDRVLEDARLRERWDLMLADLRDEPPVLVLDASHRDPGGFGNRPPEAFPLGEILRDEYTHVATVSETRIWKHTPR
jgi:hypothetical protein